MKLFHLTPGGIADAFAVNLRGNKQNTKITFFTINTDNHTTDGLAVLHNSVGFSSINGLLYCFA